MPASPSQRTATAQRRADALKLKLTGASLAAITEALGYSSVAACSKDLKRAMEKAVADEREFATLRLHQEEARLDALQAALWPAVEDGDVKAIEAALKVHLARVKLLRIGDGQASAEASRSVLGGLAAAFQLAADLLPPDDDEDDGQPTGAGADIEDVEPPESGGHGG